MISLEGPNYYVNYPTSYKGQYVLVEVDAIDVLGNGSRTCLDGFVAFLPSSPSVRPGKPSQSSSAMLCHIGIVLDRIRCLAGVDPLLRRCPVGDSRCVHLESPSCPGQRKRPASVFVILLAPSRTFL